MAKKLGEFIAELAKQAGISATDEKLKDLLAIQTEVPDDVANSISNSLMTIDAAKNNPTLKSHFAAQALSTVDATLEDVMKEAGLTDDLITELKGERSSYKRMQSTFKKVKGLHDAALKEAGKGNGGDPEKEKKLVDEISTLNKQITEIKSANETELGQLKSAHEQDLTDNAVLNYLSGKKYAFEDIPQTTNVATANGVVSGKLAEKKAKIIRTDAGLKLVLADNPDLAYMEENKEVAFSDFADTALAEGKLLKVSDPNPKPPGNNNPNNPVPPGEEQFVPADAEDFYQNQLDRIEAG